MKLEEKMKNLLEYTKTEAKIISESFDVVLSVLLYSIVSNFAFLILSLSPLMAKGTIMFLTRPRLFSQGVEKMS